MTLNQLLAQRRNTEE